jgi:hypothetical protein
MAPAPLPTPLLGKGGRASEVSFAISIEEPKYPALFLEKGVSTSSQEVCPGFVCRFLRAGAQTPERGLTMRC